MNKISAVMINFNTPETTSRALEALLDSKEVSFTDVTVIENGSEQKFTSEMAERLGVRLISNETNIGFAKAVNQGIQVSEGKYILLLNSDAFMEKDSLARLLGYLERNTRTGLIGPRFVYPGGKNQISAGKTPDLFGEMMIFSQLYKFLPGGYYLKNFKDIQRVDWLSGGCLLIRREVLERVGLLDEEYFFGVEDMDFCLRAKKDGWGAVYYPLAKVVHQHGSSSGGTRSSIRLEMEIKSFDHFFRKNFPEKTFTRWVFKTTRKIKLLIFKLLNWK